VVYYKSEKLLTPLLLSDALFLATAKTLSESSLTVDDIARKAIHSIP
jgi:hypothetical protein